MSSATGGVATATGLRFQYLATIDVLLDWLEGPRDFVITTEDPADEVIDFSVVADGSPVLLAQAKASVDGESSARLTPGEVIEQGIRLCGTPSERYLLCTNRELSPSTQELIQVLSTASSEVSAAELRTRLRETLTKPTYEKLASVDEGQLLLLTRLTVSSTMKVSTTTQVTSLDECLLYVDTTLVAVAAPLRMCFCITASRPFCVDQHNEPAGG